ncbi:MAG: hypothetical protein AAFR36_23510 [Bacteroidota bacterium]
MTEPEIFFGGATKYGLEVYPSNPQKRNLIRQLDGASIDAKEKVAQYLLITNGKTTYYVFQYNCVRTAVNNGRRGSSLSIWLKFDGVEFREFEERHKDFFKALLNDGLIAAKDVIRRSKEDDYTLYYQIESFQEKQKDLKDIIIGGKELFGETFKVEDFKSVNRKGKALKRKELGFIPIPKPLSETKEPAEQTEVPNSTPGTRMAVDLSLNPVIAKLTNELNELRKNYRRLLSGVTLMTILLFILLGLEVVQYAGLIGESDQPEISQQESLPSSNAQSTSAEPAPPANSEEILDRFFQQVDYPKCCYEQRENSVAFIDNFPFTYLQDWKPWKTVPVDEDEFLRLFAEGLLLLDQSSDSRAINTAHNANSFVSTLKDNSNDIIKPISEDGECIVDDTKTVFEVVSCLFDRKRRLADGDPIVFRKKPN